MGEDDQAPEDLNKLPRELDSHTERLHSDRSAKALVIQEHIGRYVFASQFVRDKTVLDVASGIGYGSHYLSKSGATLVIGADISFDAIARANKRYRREGLRFVAADATKMPFEDCTFQVVVSFETLEHIEQCETFLSECTRVLKDDGLFVCSTPNKRVSRFYKPDFHVKEFYPEEFFELVNKYFSEVSCFGQTRINLLKPSRFAAIRFKHEVRQILGDNVQKVLWSALKVGYDRFYSLQKKNYEKDVRVQDLLKNDNFKDALRDEHKVTTLKDNSLFTTDSLVVLGTQPKKRVCD
jgi:ubiquinone/menaquinone biosynthesis C-methylase UbiE